MACLDYRRSANGKPVQPFDCQRESGKDECFWRLGELIQIRQIFHDDNAVVEKQTVSIQFVFVSAWGGQIESHQFYLRLNQEFQSVQRKPGRVSEILWLIPEPTPAGLKENFFIAVNYCIKRS